MATQNWPVRHAVKAAIGSVVNSGLASVSPTFAVLGPNADGTMSTTPIRGTGSATFTRDDSANNGIYTRDFENNYRKVDDGEARFQGARRVQNDIEYSEDNTQASGASANNTVTTDTIEFTGVSGYRYKQSLATDLGSKTYVASVLLSSSDKAQVGLRIYSTAPLVDDFVTIDLTSTPTRYYVEITSDSAATLVEFGLDNRSAFGGDDTTSGTITATEWQLEEVTGQTNQAPSEYVATEASAVTKYFYTENQNEVAENRLRQSRTFNTTWSNDTELTFTKDSIGYDGTANTATSVEDTTVSASRRFTQSVTVPDDSNANTVSIFIGKDSDETYFPVLRTILSGGTSQDYQVAINRATGDIGVLTAATGTSAIVEDYNSNFWKVSITSVNDSSGNTAFALYCYPAASTNFSNFDASATGVTVFDQGQMILNSSTATETQVETTTAAITNVVGTKTAQWEQVDNNLTDSRDMSEWSATADITLNQDQIGYDGQANKAWSITDSNAGAGRYVNDTATIVDDSNWHTLSVYIKKDNNTARYPGVALYLTGGSTTAVPFWIFNTEDGTFDKTGGATPEFAYTEDHGDFWKFVCSVQNNSTGNTTATAYLWPALSSAPTSVSSTTGTTIFDQAQLSFNRILSFDGQVETTGSAITLGKEKALDTDLHPRSSNYGVTRFARYNKWAASTAYSVGDLIIPDTGSGPSGGNGYYYQCVVAGTSAGSEPSFGVTIADGTYDNGIVWKCKGKATVAGYLSEPARTNSITDSYDLTQWTQTGTAVSALDETGIDGVANKATTLTDDDGAASEYVANVVTVPNDSNPAIFHALIKKETSISASMVIRTDFTGGTAINTALTFNHVTGAADGFSTTMANGGYIIQDHGVWWLIAVYGDNNTSGNTSLSCRLFPAGTTVANTGSCIVGHTQAELNTSVPSSPIETTGTTETRNADDLYYDNHIVDALGAMVCSVFPFNATQAANSRVIGDTVGNTPLAYISGNTHFAYDGTNVTTGPTAQYSFTEHSKIATRWNAGTLKMQAVLEGDSGVEATYDGSWNASGLDVMSYGAGLSPLLGTISDILIYNKDLGTTKLESMTDYD